MSVKNKPKLNEEQLAEIVVNWLEREGWETYKEVPFSSGYLDILAVRGPIHWVIEVKTRLSDELIAQARGRIGISHYVSIACPLPDKGVRVSDKFYLEYHGIGLLDISSNRWNPEYNVKSIIQPSHARPSPEKRNKRIANNLRYLKARLLPEYKTEKAGVAASSRISPFKATCLMVRNILLKNGPMTPAEIAAQIEHHYSTDRGFISQLTKLYHLIEGVEYVKTDKKTWKLRINSQNETSKSE